ncbi:MAG: cytochrome ubiquinol oxidase subunit I [Candidatus Nanopelagicales bacterium]
MNALDLARWQFGITTVYHFLFVPLTIGGAFFVAGFQTAWVRTNNPRYLQLTKFFGKLFLINFAMGVVTGIVQEFQFGMNWSVYSRFVGDVFGAPLAMEGLLAFFLESTVLGLWIFGWDRLPKKVHLATIWAAAIGTMVSAYFILAANAWMQHPVGFTVDPETGRAVLNNIGAVLFQNTAVIAFLHTMFACAITAGAAVVGIAGYKMIKKRQIDVFRPAMKASGIVILLAAVGLAITGDMDAKIMVQQQPMKMAAAEGLYETTANAPFSILSIGDLSGAQATRLIEVPGLTSYLATGSFDGTVQGVNNIQAEYQQTYGPGNYSPWVPITYWGFRFMIGFGLLAALFALWSLWRFRGARDPKDGPLSKLYVVSAAGIVLAPLAANSFGWIFTEMGRQPWIVFGQQLTASAVSPLVSPLEVWITMLGFTLVYLVLAIIEVRLLLTYIKRGAPEDVVADPYADAVEAQKNDADADLYFAY